MGSHCPPRGKKIHIPQGGLWPTQMPRVGELPLRTLYQGCWNLAGLGGPTNWICLAGGQNSPPSQGWKAQGNLPRKSGLPFLVPAVRSKVFPGQGYTAPPVPKCLTWNVFLPDELSYQDVWQQPFLFNCGLGPRITVLGGEIQPASWPRFPPLGESVLELRERVKEHVVFLNKMSSRA